jgi:BMFP domain-containing protein YqiC
VPKNYWGITIFSACSDKTSKKLLKSMFYETHAMIKKERLKEISDKIRELIKNSPIEDIEENVNALLKSMFTKMDLITREEFDVQTEVLKKTRLKLEMLEKKLDQLETKKK